MFLGCGGTGVTAPPSRTLPAPHVRPGTLDARALLGGIPERAMALGAGPLSVVASAAAFEGERLGGFVDVPEDVCVLAYARASRSMEDLDVAIFSEEGTPLSVDEAPDSHPTVMLCPPHPERVYASVHVASGEGLVTLGAQLVPRLAAPVLSATFGAKGSAGEGPRPADAWPGLDDHVRAHRTGLGGHWEDVRKVALPVDARMPTFIAFPLEADQCTDALVLPSDEVALLEVEALDSEGRLLARAHEGSKARSLTLCSTVTGNASLSIRPHVGRGLAAVVVGRARGSEARELSRRPDVAWTASVRPLEEERGLRNAELAKAGYEKPTQTQQGMGAIGRRIGFTVEGKGTCQRIDVVGGLPLALVEARAWDEAGNLLGVSEGTTSAVLLSCGKGNARVEVEVRGRPGPMVILTRKEKWQSPVFEARPVAGARMLTAMGDGPLSLHEGAPFAARMVSLEPGKRTTLPETIAQGKCLRIALGVQGEGSGVEARVFDTEGVELDRGTGIFSTSLRACAPSDAAKTITLELHPLAGKLEGVVGVRSSN